MEGIGNPVAGENARAMGALWAILGVYLAGSNIGRRLDKCLDELRVCVAMGTTLDSTDEVFGKKLFKDSSNIYRRSNILYHHATPLHRQKCS